MSSPELHHPAVLVIDMHRGSVDEPGTVFVPGADAIVPALANLLDAARAHAVPVFYVVHQTLPGGADARSPFWMESDRISSLYPNIADQVVGSRWTELADGLELREGDYLLPKKRYGAFSGNALGFVLKNLEVQTLILTGVETEICILATAFHAFNEDYRVAVVSDCVAGLEAECEKAALRIIEREVGWVMSASEVVDEFARPEIR